MPNDEQKEDPASVQAPVPDVPVPNLTDIFEIWQFIQEPLGNKPEEQEPESPEEQEPE